MTTTTTHNQKTESSKTKKKKKKKSVKFTWHTSQRGTCLGEGWRREKRWCLEASLLAWWTRWSQASQRAASSAVQNTVASSLLQTSQWIFICWQSDQEMVGSGTWDRRQRERKRREREREEERTTRQ